MIVLPDTRSNSPTQTLLSNSLSTSPAPLRNAADTRNYNSKRKRYNEKCKITFKVQTVVHSSVIQAPQP